MDGSSRIHHDWKIEHFACGTSRLPIISNASPNTVADDLEVGIPARRRASGKRIKSLPECILDQLNDFGDRIQNWLPVKHSGESLGNTEREACLLAVFIIMSIASQKTCEARRKYYCAEIRVNFRNQRIDYEYHWDINVRLWSKMRKANMFKINVTENSRNTAF